MSEVISRAGIHCIGGTRTGYGEFCQRIADAGRQLSVVKVRDDLGAVDEPLKHWPDVLCVGAFTEFDRMPFDFAKFSARAKLKPQIRIWEVLNEDDASHTYAAKTDLYISIAPQFKANGWALGLFSCASGTPPYPIEDNGVAYAEIARACKWMIDNEIEAYLCVHEYQSSGGTIGRFKMLADYLEQRGALLPIIVTEYGYETHPGDTQFMNMVRTNDPTYMADRRVLGCALWTLGGGGWAGSNYQTALPALGEYIATVEPVNPPPVDEWVFSKVLINGIEYSTPTFDYTTGAGVNTLHFVYQKKGTNETCVVEVTCDPVDLLYRVVQTPAGSVFNVGQVLHFEAT